MSAIESALPTLADFLAAPLRVGDPDVHGPLAVFPLFGPRAARSSTSRSPRASRRGLLVKEIEGGASVNDLVVLNPTDVPVLLYEGEEVLGAQQNRTFDVSVLVAAGRSLRVPVSCVEHGRWDGVAPRRGVPPGAAGRLPVAARVKNRAAHARVAAGMAARADAGRGVGRGRREVEPPGVGRPTGAMHDIYEHRRDRLREFAVGDRRCAPARPARSSRSAAA